VWVWRGKLMTKDSNSTGLTQKEMMVLMMDGQEKINDRIDLLHEKVNQKMSRQELSGWMVAVSAFVVIINQLM
jgi:methyltransferase-like protein